MRNAEAECTDKSLFCNLQSAFRNRSRFPLFNGAKSVTEIDEAWALALAEAERRARAAGRGDVADFLRLRATNDLARTTGVQWLLDTFLTLAGTVNRQGAGLALERQGTHRFRVGNATMAGSQLTLRAGVRALTVEAGWPRLPADGIVRGGGLACGRVSHFGDRAAGAELLLVRAGDGVPHWLALDEQTGARAPFSEDSARLHLTRLLR